MHRNELIFMYSLEVISEESHKCLIYSASKFCSFNRYNSSHIIHPPHIPILSTSLHHSLTTEGGVSPADRDSSAMTGLSVSVNVIAQSRLHAIILAHVIDAVPQERFWRNERVTGLEEIR